MFKLTIKPAAKIKGNITVPPDKSISHRAVMVGALTNGETMVENFLFADDCLRTVDCFEHMGINIQKEVSSKNISGRLVIKGKGLYGLKKPTDILCVGNSGTTIRILLGILAGQKFSSTISGDESIRKRPMRRVIEPLRLMGAKIDGFEKKENNEIYAPLKISEASLKNISYQMPIASAQVKSSLLFSSLFAAGKTSIIEPIPTRDHTERMFKAHNIKVEIKDKTIFINGGQSFSENTIFVPGDISSAAFFIVAACIIPNSELTIQNVLLNSFRIGIINVLKEMKANIEIIGKKEISNEIVGTIRVYSSKLKGINISKELIPSIIDELPILAVAATQADGKTVISGAKELRFKETDRIKSMTDELLKLGARIQALPDGMVIDGPTKLNGGICESYGDHRTAMALAIAGLIAHDSITVNNTECINTSFPNFEDILREVVF